MPTSRSTRDGGRTQTIALLDALDFAEQGRCGPLQVFMSDAAYDWYNEDPAYAEQLARHIEHMRFSAELIEEVWHAISAAAAGDEVLDAVETFFREIEDEINV